jgi:alkylation response protein AidB-like acyl-CoA dehydrogenase
MAYGATEPEASSDLGALRTRARRARRCRSGLRLSHQRREDADHNGGYADLYSVLALASGGPTWFIVEKGAAGLGHGKPEDKHGSALQYGRAFV